jgi:hypothetical protein
MSRPHFVRETWPVHPAKRCRVDGGLRVVVVMFRCGSGSALIWFCGGLVYVGIERSSCRSGGMRIVTDLPMVLAPAFARLILARRQFFPLFFNALRWSASRRLSLKVRAFCNSCSILLCCNCQRKSLANASFTEGNCPRDSLQMLARSRSSVSECFSAFAPHLFVLTHDSAMTRMRQRIGARGLLELR